MSVLTTQNRLDQKHKDKAMAGTIPKVIDDSLLKCKLCINPFNEPKILPCLHVFCKGCLTKYMGTLPREKHKSAALDPKVLEEALSANNFSLDQEIPIHGYDDVVGHYPSLPKMPKSNRTSLNRQSQKKVEGEYSEVASPEDDTTGLTPGDQAGDEGRNLSLGVYTLEKALPANGMPYLPMTKPNSSERSKSDPIDERKVQEHLHGQSQSARSSRVEPGSQGKLSAGPGLVRTNTYLPMDRGSPKSSQKDLNHVGEPGMVDTMNKGYEVMVSGRNVNGNKKHKPDNDAMLTGRAGESSVPVDKPLSLITPTSPDSYDVSAAKNQSMQLTGFGLASPVNMSLFKTSRPAVNNPESIYQMERTGITTTTSNAEETGDRTNTVLSKRTSQSVDMLSTATVLGDKKISKQSSEGDLKGLQLSIMTHSLSTGDMAVEAEHQTASSTSDQTLSPKVEDPSANPGEKLTYSPTSGHDGYETPLTQRNPSNELSPSSTVGSPPMLHKLPPKQAFVSDEVIPALPPKQGPSSSKRLSCDTVSLQAIEMGPAPPVPRMKQNSDKTAGIRRRLAVGETLSPTKSDPDSNPDNWRDSVFVDHIYEEIQYNASQRTLRRSKEGGVSKNHANVPMMRPLKSGKVKTSSTSSASRSKGSTKKPAAAAPTEEFNPRLHKAKNVLKKSKQYQPPRHASGDSEAARIGGLQVGSKLMRKSSVLLDESGFPYISDHFEKVSINHNNEDIELIYSEVSDLASSTNQLPRPPVSTIPTNGDTSKITHNSSSNANLREMACPTCQSLFQLPNGDVNNLPSCTFIENLKGVRDLENTLRPSCKNCKQKSAEFKCLECDHYLCRRCNDSHKWFKVVQGHHVMTLTELQSGKYTSQIMGKKREVCPNHCNEPPQFYCDTCNHAVCKECAHCYHRGHPCLPMGEVSQRGVGLLTDFQSMTRHISQQYREENLQLDKYRMQYNHDKKRLASQVIGQYVHATKMLEESYQELLRHIEHRYGEEVMYIDEIQKRNKQFLTRVEQTNRLADHVSEYGNDCDVINMTKLLMQNLLDMENYQPIKLENKMEIHFTPLLSVRPIDVLPLIGQASREYKPIKKVEGLDVLSAGENDWSTSNEPIKHLHTFTPKTESDKKGCKPTGIALTRDDNIVLVDDINRKIKIFTEEGQLVHEIVPTNREELVDPWDVTVTNYGNFAVTDRGSKRVKIFDPDGDLVCEFGPHLANPWGICCNRNGDLIVTDTDHRCVFVHDSNGNLKFKVTAPAKLAKFPEYVTTNSMGDIIVSDLKAHCVYVFNLLGQFLFKVGPKDIKNPKVKVFHSPCGIYTDAEDNILVADYEMVRVSKFNRNGRFLSHYLTYMDSLQAPQSLVVNRKGHVVLSDGNFVKTFAMDEAELVNLELKPKVYNLKKANASGYRKEALQRPGSQSPEVPVKAVHGSVDVKTDKEDYGSEEHAKESRTADSHPVARPVKSDPVAEPFSRSRPSRSSSTSRYHDNSDKNTLPNYGTPAMLLRAIQDYDSPRVSVKKIKERLTSIDRSNSGRDRRDENGNGRGTPNPVIRNIETSKVSIDKVKEQLLSKDSGNHGGGVMGPKPKLQPKPSFKQISEHMMGMESNKKMVNEGPCKADDGRTRPDGKVDTDADDVAGTDMKNHQHRLKQDQTQVSGSTVSDIKDTAHESKVKDMNDHHHRISQQDLLPVEGSKVKDTKDMGHDLKAKDNNTGSKVKDVESKVKDPDTRENGVDPEVQVVVSKVSSEDATGGLNLAQKDKEASSVIKSKETDKKSGSANTKMSPLKVGEKKKQLKVSPSISRKDGKSKKSPKLFRTSRKPTNKGNSSEC